MRVSRDQALELQRQARERKEGIAPTLLTPRVIIGIDPGDNTGVAKLVREPEASAGVAFRVVQTYDFWSCFDYVTKNFEQTSTVLVIEQGGLNRPIFRRVDDRMREQYTKQGRSIGSKEEESFKRAQDRAAQNVGQANEQALLLIKGFKRLGFYVIPVRPVGKKYQAWTAEVIRELTAYDGRTNPHTRVATCLAWEHRHLLLSKNVRVRI